MPWYATSRIRTWLKLKVGSPARRPPSASISCLRTSASRWAASGARPAPSVGAGSGGRGAVGELEQCAAAEGLPDHGGGLRRGALGRLEAVHAGGEQRVDG